MNNKFDELTKNMAQSVTRRAALKKFGLGLAGMALACFGLADKAGAATYHGYCEVTTPAGGPDWYYTGRCLDINGCVSSASADCPAWGTAAQGGKTRHWLRSACFNDYDSRRKCSFTI